ncbi:MAG TPA: purine-nucleoside phosphorylase [Candidatus Tyrphobacter sp.]
MSIDKDAALIRSTASGEIDLAIVLGSGLAGALSSSFQFASIPYARLTSLPFSPLPGHRGEALVGRWHGRKVLAFSGRAHLYQGFTPAQVTSGVRLAKAAGASAMLLTNAAGALDPACAAGDLMLIADHLNLTGCNPLTGGAVAQPFVDMSDAYAERLRAIVRRHATQPHRLREGVYAGLPGPSYETPAEARYLRTIGGDAVGMSTVLETIMARALGMQVLGFSLVTNVVGAAETTHEEVMAMADESAPRLADLIDKTLPEI